MIVSNKLKTLCLSSVLAFSMIGTPAIAAPASGVDEARQTMTNYGTELTDYENQIATASERLEGIKQEMGNTEQQISTVSQQYDEKRDQLSDRMRVTYKDGGFSLVDLFFGSSNLQDFIANLYYIIRMNDFDINLMNEATSLHEELMKYMGALEAEKADCEDIIANADAKVEELSAKVAEAQNYFNSLPTEVQEALATEVAAQIESGSYQTNDQGVVTDGLVSAVANVAVANYAQAVSEGTVSAGGDGEGAATTATGGGAAASVVQAVSNSISSGGGGYSAGLSSAVDKAYSVIGTQYTYGGMSVETGFDCSGLVNYAYGGDRGRSTGDMISSLQSSGDWKTSIDDLQYGDLVFPSEGHVGIYIGDGQMIHSPVPGQSVEVSNVYSFYGGGTY